MKKYNIFILVFIAFIFSCRPTDEDITPVLGECDSNFPENLHIIGLSDSKEARKYPISAYYNPLNQNELLVYEKKKEPSGLMSMDLYLFDRTKKCKKKIVDNLFLGSSNISENGWIAFVKNGETWKIKTNGSQLSKVTNFLASNLNWNPDASSLLLFADGELKIAENGTVRNLRDVYGLSDQFDFGYWDYTGTKLLLKSGDINGPYISTYDTVSHSYNKLMYSQNNGYMDWLRDNLHVIWYNNEGISILNTETGESTLIRSECESRIYFSLKPSPDGTKIIGIRNDIIWIKGQTFENDYNIIEMNIDGTNERRIDF